ncbi:MAG: hypothetical protein H5T99_06105 [Moorella sp. (in: Bacteria)]|nr:hypothetical protein [Moorella sp. (in: firmicutes)]
MATELPHPSELNGALLKFGPTAVAYPVQSSLDDFSVRVDDPADVLV